MQEQNFRYFEFGDFRLDAHRRILQKKGETIPISPRIFDLLHVMVENPGRVLEHDELLDKVWKDAFVEQGNLKKTISALRQALGESPKSGEYITTVPRRGYRFTAPVRPLPDQAVFIRETTTEITIEEEIEHDAQNALPQDRRSHAFPKRQIAFAVIATILLAAASVSAWFFLSRSQQRLSIADLRYTTVLSADNIGNGMPSADGSYFAYTVLEGEGRGLWVKQSATGGETQVVSPQDASFWWLAFTPDNHYLYFYLSNREEPSKNGIYRIPVIGGPAQLISEKRYGGLKISPDGKSLAVFETFSDEGLERQKILTLDAEGNNEKEIVVLPPDCVIRGLVWSPDGRSLLYGVKRQPPGEKPLSYVVEVPAEGGAEKILMPEQEKSFEVQEWMPDKSSFVLRQREANSEIFQIWQYFPSSGESSRVTNDGYSYSDLRVTPDGRTVSVFRTIGLSSIWLADETGNDLKQIFSGSNFFSISWAGDGRLIFSATEDAKEFVGIMNADGTGKRLLTSGGDGIRPFPAVSGDGKQIVFLSERSGSREVWQMDMEGRNLKQLTDKPGTGEAKLLSDGQTLIYTNYVKNKGWSLMKRGPDGSPMELMASNTWFWTLSPDEKFVAVYAEDETLKKQRIFIIEIATGQTGRMFDISNMHGLLWTRDGNCLMYLRKGDNSQEIVLLPLDGGAERILATVRGDVIRNFDLSPDGKRLALVRSKFQTEAVSIGVDQNKK